ncbi:hypothetical protein TNIN_355501 [Trichonephila inaurata madagascariensis]|uniref:DUF5641 domain-containing protein n=1 Tax=Trichonephila inaurata madagascariensis TaxID=2747483 RepID=A0A8X6X0X9_9ARAC|nr:hypothetical protein TNIN_355501 [Trichonephila inaurata madagascariensis]
MKWTLARVIKIHPGEDGLVRVVDVKTAKGTFTRAVTNLMPLPGDVGLSPNGGRDVIATKKTNYEKKTLSIAGCLSATTSGRKLFPAQ